MSLSQVTVNQASFLTGKSRQTLNKYTRKGKLSFSLDERGTKVIEISELGRVFDIVRNIDDLGSMSEIIADEAEEGAEDQSESSELAVLRVRYEGLMKECEMLTEERQRERELYRQQIDSLQNSLDKIQDQHGRTILMLTDQTEEGKGSRQDSEQALRVLTEKVERLGQQNKRMYRELQRQKNSGFWKWLRGAGSTGQKQREPSAQASQ